MLRKEQGGVTAVLGNYDRPTDMKVHMEAKLAIYMLNTYIKELRALRGFIGRVSKLKLRYIVCRLGEIVRNNEKYLSEAEHPEVITGSTAYTGRGEMGLVHPFHLSLQQS